jgi:hypothetical protein
MGIVAVDEVVADGAVQTSSEELWRRVKADYDTKQYTQLQLSKMHGVTLSALKHRIKTHLWEPRYRSKQIDRPQIIARLFRILELQVKDLEMEMNEMAQSARRSGDKEVTLLGRLAGNVGKLMELDAQVPHKRRGAQRTKQMEDIRNKLVERIEQLKRS